jgi:hypothetical protein
MASRLILNEHKKIIEMQNIARCYKMGTVEVYALKNISLCIIKESTFRSWGHQVPGNRH